MKYELNDKQIDAAKQVVKKLRKERQKWVDYKNVAKLDLEKNPKKYYHGIKVRISSANKRINSIDQRVQEFKDAIKKRYITI